MKIPKPFLLLVAAFLAFGALTPPPARAQVSVSFFYDSLDPYGQWMQTADYGYVWQPSGVDENWAPYSDGYWAYTDAGWTWVSYEDYGGVVYHYGRWTRLPDVGWVWVPGNTWAPAWVSWRTSDDYVGWAPLPPEARWNAEVGFSPWVDVHCDIGPGFYSFVHVHDFGAPALGPVIVTREQNVSIINNTTNITNITVNNSTVYNGGPSYAKYSALSARPIPTLKLVRQSTPAEGGKILSRQQGNQLMVVAPKVTGGTAGAPRKVARTIGHVTPDHGWSGVKDPQEREKLQAHFKDQAKSAGPETAHAKPVNPADVKLVGEKIKTGAASKPVAEEEKAAPEKGKAGKTPNATDLVNAPAKEAPGAATANETPKVGKGKGKKARATPAGEEAAAMPGETPAGKIKKSKKAKTPSEEQPGAADYETPSKHAKKSSSDLQPFMSGDEEKPRKSEPTSPKGYEARPPEAGYPAAEAKTPKGEKGEKGDKKKQEEQGLPPGQ